MRSVIEMAESIVRSAAKNARAEIMKPDFGKLPGRNLPEDVATRPEPTERPPEPEDVSCKACNGTGKAMTFPKGT